MRSKKTRECVSPVDCALLFGHYSLEVGELEEAVVEVVQVENTHQQEGSRNANPGEQLSQFKLLQAHVRQAAETWTKFRENRKRK